VQMITGNSSPHDSGVLYGRAAKKTQLADRRNKGSRQGGWVRIRRRVDN